MTPTADWTLWTTGVVLVLGGGVMLLRALFGDRARGRRRCPRCWYDLSGSDELRCSECGYTARSARKLRKTRRRWRRAAAAMLIIAMGTVSGLTPAATSSGYARLIPTTVLVMLMPELPGYSASAADELVRRLNADTVADWQWRWLVERLLQDGDLWKVDIHTRDRWPSDVELYGVVLGDPLFETRWLGRRLYRARVTSTVDGDAPPQTVALGSAMPPRSASFSERAVPLGFVPDGATFADFDVAIESERFKDRSEPAVRLLHRRTQRVPVVISGTLEDYLTPDDGEELTDVVAGALSFDLRNGFLRVVAAEREQMPGLVCPIRIELRGEGRPLAHWSLWWVPGRRHTEWLSLPSTLEGNDRPFGTTDYAATTWSLHLAGEPGRALMDPDATRFWSGALTVPLHLEESESMLRYRSGAPTTP